MVDDMADDGEKLDQSSAKDAAPDQADARDDVDDDGDGDEENYSKDGFDETIKTNKTSKIAAVEADVLDKKTQDVPKENLPPENYQPGADPDNQAGEEALKAAPMQ